MKQWYPEVDLAILHPKIYTVALSVEDVVQGKTTFPIIEDGGVAIKGGNIAAVGSANDIESLIGEHTEVIDATGKIMTPGFVESHMHAFATGLSLQGLVMAGITKREEALRLVRERAASLPEGAWLMGDSLNELIWDVPEMLTRADLDEVAPNNPCWITRMCHHVAMVNSAALKLAEVTRDTSDPNGGTIGHDKDGELNGLLYEGSAMELVESAIPRMTPEQSADCIAVAGSMLNKLGITSVVDACLTFEQMRAYLVAKQSGKLSYRANLMFFLDSAYGDKETNLRRLEEMDCITGFGDEMLKMNAIKVTLDGIPVTYTALMREPYKTRPNYCGSSIWSQEDITAFVCKANELGWQFGIHTIGDACADMALNAFEAANTAKPLENRRNYLIHYQFPQDDQWERMRNLSIGVALQPTLVSVMGEAPQFYPEQAERIQSPGLMFKNGIVCGGSSDSPVVSPDPMMGMYYAITRLDETTGDTLSKGDESKVSPHEALIMWTKNAAWFSHDDDKMGSVEAGNLADILLFDNDFLAGDVEAYRTTKVSTTILNGKIVYQA